MLAAGFLQNGHLLRRCLLAMLLCVLVFACGLSPHTHSMQQSIRVIQNFDLARYAGPWYVLAHSDHPAKEHDLIQTSVYYSRNDDGSLSVIQRGLNPAKRQWIKRKCLALPAGAPHQGALKISSGNFSSDYNVVALDAQYHWALVLGASVDRAWVLSRTPNLPAAASASLLHQARLAGVNTEQLQWIPQERAPSAMAAL